MTPELVPRGVAAAGLVGSWQSGSGALIFTPQTGDPPPAPPVHPGRAQRRRPRRGRRIEDILTAVIATAAAALSATGPLRVGQHPTGLADRFGLLPFFSPDATAMAPRRRARAGEGSGLSLALFWVPRQQQHRFLRRQGHLPPRLRCPRRLADARRRAMGVGAIRSPLDELPAQGADGHAPRQRTVHPRRPSAVLTRRPAPQGVRGCPPARP